MHFETTTCWWSSILVSNSFETGSQNLSVPFGTQGSDFKFSFKMGSISESLAALSFLLFWILSFEALSLASYHSSSSLKPKPTSNLS